MALWGGRLGPSLSALHDFGCCLVVLNKVRICLLKLLAGQVLLVKVNQLASPLGVVLVEAVLKVGKLVEHGGLVVPRAERHTPLVNVGHPTVVRQVWIWVPVDKDVVQLDLALPEDIVQEAQRVLPGHKDAPRHSTLKIKREGERLCPRRFGCHSPPILPFRRSFGYGLWACMGLKCLRERFPSPLHPREDPPLADPVQRR